MCGTPASGKTVLSELLMDYHRGKETKAFLIKQWSHLQSLGCEDHWDNFTLFLKER